MSDFFSDFVPEAWQSDGCFVVVRRVVSSAARVARVSWQIGAAVVASSLILTAPSVAAVADAPPETASRGADDDADPAFWRDVSAMIGRFEPRPAEEAGIADPELPDVDA